MTTTGFLNDIARRALSSLGTVHATYAMAKYCIDHGVPGDFVECGVFAGVQCAAMARACMDAGVTDRRVHLFDSFEGIPKAGPHDNDIRPLVGSADGRLMTSGVSACSVDQVKGHMREWGVDESLLVYHPGWFQDTVPRFSAGQIALLRLDGDLYDSTAVCLDHLYPRLSEGGWCIADDFHLDGCRKAIDERLHVGPAYWQRA